MSPNPTQHTLDERGDVLCGCVQVCGADHAALVFHAPPEACGPKGGEAKEAKVEEVDDSSASIVNVPAPGQAVSVLEYTLCV